MNTLEAIESSSIARLIIGTIWGFPIAEIAHLCFITVTFGSMVLMDLRLLGLLRAYPLTTMKGLLLKSVWVSFAGSFITGGLLFTSMATRYVEDLAFIVKMYLLLAAGINALFMHYIAMRQYTDLNAAPPIIVRCSAALSLCLWVGILACGRLIAYFYPY